MMFNPAQDARHPARHASPQLAARQVAARAGVGQPSRC
ncbi:hypothetical protein CBA19C6_01540 [Cupriavidus pauculus]|nr:hypothetical protein CBA19C6_01540 [Cupriavidus pauculus]